VLAVRSSDDSANLGGRTQTKIRRADGIKRPGTVIPGCGVARETEPKSERERIDEARRLKKNRH
jgi:hypothetical protein